MGSSSTTSANRACVNPAHLEPVTQRENVMRSRGSTAALALKTHCDHGHPLSGANLAIGPDGHRRCRECSRRRVREYRARNADRLRLRKRLWTARNAARERERKRGWRARSTASVAAALDGGG